MARINVTKTFLPPADEYHKLVDSIWASGQLTNQGSLLQEFEESVKDRLGVANFQFVTNGTLALQLAIGALELGGAEVITTPFSYVATTSAILWEGAKPVFVDIEPDTFCIDAEKIEAAITPKTKAILAVHVFGYPCDVEKIDAIAQKHDLKVIYDAAHAFGAEHAGKSLLAYGDISVCSFHATKLFHTIEGGAIIAKDDELNKKIDLMKRFGHNGDDHLTLGINAKASEFQAAMGLANLKYVDEQIEKRKEVDALYRKTLAGKVQMPKPTEGHNYAYFPIVFENEERLHDVMEKLAELDIHPRRYFYPALNQLPYLQSNANCPVAEKTAKTILCLPFYADLEPEIIEQICQVVVS